MLKNRMSLMPRHYHDPEDKGAPAPEVKPAPAPAPAPEVKPDPELEALKAKLAELEAFKTKAELEKLSEAERLQKETEEAKAELVKARREAVAAKFNLPDALAARLQGSTREELEADAKQLAEFAPKAPPANTGNPPGGDPKPKQEDAIAAKEADIKKALEAKDLTKALKLKSELAALKRQTK